MKLETRNSYVLLQLMERVKETKYGIALPEAEGIENPVSFGKIFSGKEEDKIAVFNKYAYNPLKVDQARNFKGLEKIEKDWGLVHEEDIMAVIS